MSQPRRTPEETLQALAMGPSRLVELRIALRELARARRETRYGRSDFGMSCQIRVERRLLFAPFDPQKALSANEGA